MLKAVAHHWFLLMTMSHSGKGLPQKWADLALFFVPYAAASFFRWYPHLSLQAVLLGAVILPFIFIYFDSTRRLISGFMMISAAVDTIDIIMPSVPIYVWFTWETAALMALMFKLSKEKHLKIKEDKEKSS